MLRQKIKLNIISGFLGSGKTTTILSYIKKRPHEKLAILVNEFGENSIDGITFSETVKTLYEVAGGCFCCSSKLIFQQKLIEIARTKNIHRLIVEPSGISSTSEIIDIVLNSNLNEHFDVLPVITLANPKYFISLPSEHRALAMNQLMNGSIIVCNFIDTVDYAYVVEFSSIIKSLYPKRLLVFSKNGDLDPGYFDDLPTNLIPDQFQSVAKPSFSSHSTSWSSSVRFTSSSVDEFFKKAAVMDLERGKGIFYTEKGWFRYELANRQLYKAFTEYREQSRLDLIFLESKKDAISGLLANL
jgi:G3E family GTPase